MEDGFCSKRIDSTIAAFTAIDSIADLEAKALNNFASSDTKDYDFPALPNGTLKRFSFQCTTSS